MKTIRELFLYREMIVSLVRKDLRGRYKASVLGFLWTFINPLLQLSVYTIVFSTILKSGIDKYYLFLFVALIPWMFFASSITAGSTCVVSQQGMVTKIYFPREVLPVAYVTSAFVNMLLCFIVVLVVVLCSGVKLNILGLLCLPIIMAVEYLMALGIAFIVSAITVYFRDMEHILGIATMAWQFLTPIMYPLDVVPQSLIPLFYLNPMTPVITAYRDVLYYGKIPQIGTLTHAAILGLLLVLVGGIIFSKLKCHFAEEL